MKPVYSVISENETLLDLLDLVSNSAKFTERVQTLIDSQTRIKKDLGDLETVQKVKGMEAATAAKLAEAENIRRKADEYVATRKAEADDVYAKQMDQIQRSRSQSGEFAKELDVRANELGKRERALDTRDTAMLARAQELAKREVEAKSARDGA